MDSALPLHAGSRASASDPLTIDLRNDWRVQVYTEWSFPARVLSAWSDMARAHGDIAIFLESGWFEVWWHTMGRGGRLWAPVVEHAGAVMGIFPCWIDEEGCPRGLADDVHYDFLLAPDKREETIAGFAEAWRRAGFKRTAALTNFTGTSDAPSLLQRQLGRRSIPSGTYTEEFAPYVELKTTTWEAYHDSLHSKLKNNLKKGRRRAEKEGVLSFEAICAPDDLDGLLTDLFEVEARSWKGENQTAIRDSEKMEAFYRGIARWAMQSGRLRLAVLRLDERIIAFDFGVACGRTLFAMKTGYDQSVADRFSPGNTMRHDLIRHLFDDGSYDRYDFLGPWFPWKREWTSEAGRFTLVEAYPRTVSGWTEYLRKYGWKEPIKRSQPLLALAKRLRAKGR